MSFGRMRASDIPMAEDLFLAFLESDPHYRDVAAVYGDGGPQALRSALEMFADHPELGFVWIARQGEDIVGCCVVAFAIST